MSTSNDNSDLSDSDISERVLKEPDPSNVPYYFLKTGKSKSEGVLITHSDSFKFTKNNVNRNGTLHYYACSMKLTHKCPARAILRRTVELDENGEEVVLNELLEIATPEISWILYSRMVQKKERRHHNPDDIIDGKPKWSNVVIVRDMIGSNNRILNVDRLDPF